MEIRNEADKIQRTIKIKYTINTIMCLAPVVFFMIIVLEGVFDKYKIAFLITLGACMLVLLILLKTLKKDRLKLAEAQKYFYGGSTPAEQMAKKNSIETLRENNKKSAVQSILGESASGGDSQAPNGEVQIGKYEFKAPGQKQETKQQTKFNTGVRANGSTFGTSSSFGSSVLDRFK